MEFNKEEYYKTAEWRHLRESVLRERPYCYNGITLGLLNPALECHHCIKWADLPTDELKWKLFTDKENIIPVTADVHKSIHGNQKILSPRFLQYIQDLKNYISLKYLNKGYIICYNDTDKNRRGSYKK